MVFVVKDIIVIFRKIKTILILISFKRNFSHPEKSILNFLTGRSAVGNVSGYRCVSDCNSRGHEFDPGPVPYFRGD